MLRISLKGGGCVLWLAVLVAVLTTSGAFGQGLWSSLYPPDWSPGYADAQGRFLHDFSYSGYRNGETPLPTGTSGTVYDVVSAFGADNSGGTDATADLQAAIDAAELGGGGVVYLPAGLYLCDDALTVTESNIALRGAGVGETFVYFTSHEGWSRKAHITFRGSVSRGADILLAEDAPNQSAVVRVADATGLEVGDEVAVGWVITEAFVAEHGMTGTWVVFNGQWKPFFRREIVAIAGASPAEVTLDVPLRYPAKLRDGASLRVESGYLSECLIKGMSISNAVVYDDAWENDGVRVIEFSGVKDSALVDIASFASPLPGTDGYHLQSGGIEVRNAKRVTVANCVMESAQHLGVGGNGYLYEMGQCSEILYRDCVARDGRHGFAQNWDFGATGIVWLRCESSGSTAVTVAGFLRIPVPAYSEYHHSLATANLVDSCLLTDGWSAGNRGDYSSGAGHSAAQCVCWNTDGGGEGHIRSYNYGHGYVIGTRDIVVVTRIGGLFGALGEGTEPVDFTELLDQGDRLLPQSLYEDQLQRRLNSAGLPTQLTERFVASWGDSVCFRVIHPGSAGPGDFIWTFTPELGGAPRVLPGEYGAELCIEQVRGEHAGTYCASYDNGAKVSAVYTAELSVAENLSVSGGAALFGSFVLTLLTSMACFRTRAREA